MAKEAKRYFNNWVGLEVKAPNYGVFTLGSTLVEVKSAPGGNKLSRLFSIHGRQFRSLAVDVLLSLWERGAALVESGNLSLKRPTMNQLGLGSVFPYAQHGPNGIEAVHFYPVHGEGRPVFSLDAEAYALLAHARANHVKLIYGASRKTQKK